MSTSNKKTPSNKNKSSLEEIEKEKPLKETEKIEKTKKSDKTKNNKKTSNKKENIHAGHRKRLRNRLLKEGGESFEKHQLLELLLFNPIARRDTNPIAHRLLNNFNNSFTILMNSDYEDIMKKAQVNEDVVAFIKALGDLVKVCQKEKIEDKLTLNTAEKSGEYAVNMLMHEATEKFYIFCLDSALHLLKPVEISKGNQSKVPIHGPDVVREALLAKSVFVILAHNHPAGTLNPSQDDINLTIELKRLLKSVEIKVADHIIVANEKYMSFAEKGLL